MIVRSLRRRTASALLAACLAAGAGEAAEWTVLAPRDGFKASVSSAWLVVKGPRPPRVVLDGKVLAVPPAPAKGVFHLRLAGLRREGSRLEVGEGPSLTRLTISAGGDVARGFHAAPPKACWSCHKAGPGGCGSCHRWKGSTHEPLRAGTCEDCHVPGAPLPREVSSLCVGCHPTTKGGRHGKLRHPLSAPQDPARPGRPLDCTSCHDPHAPAALGRLSQEAQRAWCKGCHRR